MPDEEPYDSTEEIEDIEQRLSDILSPEEIVSLQQEQITQLQDRVQYVEELEADILEFMAYLMRDLDSFSRINVKKIQTETKSFRNQSG